ncbi:Uncharacterised protein [Raoultella planticola]|nr:Uncharacterised protein [Raoultella planticola]
MTILSSRSFIFLIPEPSAILSSPNDSMAMFRCLVNQTLRWAIFAGDVNNSSEDQRIRFAGILTLCLSHAVTGEI